MNKLSAIERETDCIIVFNNYKGIHNINETEERNKEDEGIEMTDLAEMRKRAEENKIRELERQQEIENKRKEGIYLLEGKVEHTPEFDFTQLIPKIKDTNELKSKEKTEQENIEKYKDIIESSQNANEKFIIEYRKTKHKQDIFQKILKYFNDNLDFCQLNPIYVRDSLFDSDFIMFINDINTNTSNEVKQYFPLCMAFMKVFNNNVTHKNYIYISTFCSDLRFGQCGTYLMNTIKYVASLLNCSEIRLDSVRSSNTLKFYKSHGFNDINESSTAYSHYYILTPEDSNYKRVPAITGTARIIENTSVEGGNSIRKNIKSKKSKKRTLRKKSYKFSVRKRSNRKNKTNKKYYYRNNKN